MTINKYFKQGARSEQNLYEDLVIESLKMFGTDVNYLPRTVLNKDTVWQEALASKFDNAYRIEMYIENTDGFDGEGDLFTKFGVEIRDIANFVVSRKRWNQLVAPYENDSDTPMYRPREGDLIHLPLSNSIFQIQKVFDETPFYQLKNLPVFRISCELFEYSDEDFDTGVDRIDAVESFGYQDFVRFSGDYDSVGPALNELVLGEELYQIVGTNRISADIVGLDFSDSDNKYVYLSNITNEDSDYRTFATGIMASGLLSRTGFIIDSVGVRPWNEQPSGQFSAQNDIFDTEYDSFKDFSESNPFGDA